MALRAPRFRIPNPTPVQWGVIGLVGAFALGLGGAAIAGRRRRQPLAPPPEPTLPPVGPPIEPPPSPEPPPEPPPIGTLEWHMVTATDPGYPWEFPALHHENYPTPSTWFDANWDGAFDPANGFDKFVTAVLGSALAMAGNDWRIATAIGQDPNADLGRKLRRQVRESIIVVGGINDLLYGQTNLNYAGGNDPNKPGGNPMRPLVGTYLLNDAGRSLNWLPRHADNIERLQAGERLKRTTSLNGQKLAPPNSGSQQMLIWTPAYDLEALGPEKAVPTIRFLAWSDGSSTLYPPPQILDLGVDLQGVPGAEALQ